MDIAAFHPPDYGLIDDDPLPSGEDERVGSAEIHGQIAGEEAAQEIENHAAPLLARVADARAMSKR